MAHQGMSCSPDKRDGICWFCKKGRHADCMGNIPTDSPGEGPHDCTFDTRMVPCACGHRE